jgi:hypothetical protein
MEIRMSTLGNGKHTEYPGADGTLEGALDAIEALLAACVADDRRQGAAGLSLVSPATMLRDLEAWLDAEQARLPPVAGDAWPSP